MKKFTKTAGAMLVLGMSLLGLTACNGAATPSGMCGWVVGDGKSGHDAKVKKTLYPDEETTVNSDQVAQYVPCGPRNYIVTDGSVNGPDGKPIGDRLTPIEAVTSTGVPVLVQLGSYWQLNQQPDALTKFKEFCNKYECYTTTPQAGSSKFASDEWNGMLAENVGPAIEAATKAAMKDIPDDIWKKKDPVLNKKLATALSTSFAEALRVRTGYNLDVLCGSGNSGWEDPVKHENFTCTNVRFEITDVKARDDKAQTNANVESQADITKQANQSRFDSTKPIYGDETARWLGLQDTIKSCPQGATCNFYVDSTPTK